MKKFLLLMGVVLCASLTAVSQTWESFSRNEPTEPEVKLLRSDNQQVTFSISLSGFFYEEKTEGGAIYRRLSLPACGAMGETGAPELPVVVQRIAVPQCQAVHCAVTVTATETRNNYLVYPVPELQETLLPGGGVALEEIFVRDSGAYNQNRYLPGADGELSEQGALRAQHFAVVGLYPFQYNPVTQTLQIATEMEITLTFDHPETAVNVNTGIFNNVATNTLLNYIGDGLRASVNDKAFEKEGFEPGRVQWITLTDTLQADTICADYLIICAEPFFEPENEESELLRFSRYRAQYNGFDVAILNVEDIISDTVGFYFEGNPDDPYDPEKFKKEQRIRTCIRKVYEGANAHHTYDNRLGYVLLVGDVDEGNSGMPTSFNTPGNSSHDYYFSCITKDAIGQYDGVGDLYIGRFCIPNDLNIGVDGGLTRLYNMVEKTIRFESEYAFESWRDNATFINGDTFTSEYWNAFYPQISAIMQNQNIIFSNRYDFPNILIEDFVDDALALINQGCRYLGFNTHGYSDAWCFNGDDFYQVTASYLKSALTNSEKTPFCTTHACSVGDLDNQDVSCLAEEMTAYSADKGFVAMIASTRTVLAHNGLPVNEFAYRVPHAIYNNLSHIAGEIFLESKLRTTLAAGQYVLFGDPALNIMAEGFEVTRNTIADSVTHISCPVRVHNGATLSFPSGGSVYFDLNGQLTVEEDGGLVLGSQLSSNPPPEFAIHLYGGLSESSLAIYVKGGDFTARSNLFFHNLQAIVLESVRDPKDNLLLVDFNKQFSLQNATFNNTPLWHGGSKLSLTNCVFNNSDVNSGASIALIDACDFNVSALTIEQRDCLGSNYGLSGSFAEIKDCIFFAGNSGDKTAITLKHIPAFDVAYNEIYGYDCGIFMHLSGWGDSNSFHARPFINTFRNQISNCFIGAQLYHSMADIQYNHIYDNHFGVRLFNHTVSYFSGNVNTTLGEQIIKDNDSYELYASYCSFPSTFIYNQIIDEDNGGNSASPRDPLFYYDSDESGASNPGFGTQIYKNIPWNYWGSSFNYNEDIYSDDPTVIINVDPVWTKLGSGNITSDLDAALYTMGRDYFAAGEYVSAESAFLELIETYPESHYATAALHELFALEQFLDNDYESLRDFYRETDYIAADSVLFATADFLATRCDVRMQNWQPPIDWYEDRIQNPPSFQDSIFAVIDIGEIFLMMELEEDSTGLKAAQAIHTTMAHLIPKSEAEFVEHKADLLALLPKIDKEEPFRFSAEQKGALLQNIPNPASETTTIKYGLAVEGEATIVIYNLLGQTMKTVSLGKRAAGSYQTEVSLSGLPAGTYLYALFVDGERSDTKKMLIK